MKPSLSLFALTGHFVLLYQRQQSSPSNKTSPIMSRGNKNRMRNKQAA